MDLRRSGHQHVTRPKDPVDEQGDDYADRGLRRLVRELSENVVAATTFKA